GPWSRYRGRVSRASPPAATRVRAVSENPTGSEAIISPATALLEPITAYISPDRSPCPALSANAVTPVDIPPKNSPWQNIGTASRSSAGRVMRPSTPLTGADPGGAVGCRANTVPNTPIRTAAPSTLAVGARVSVRTPTRAGPSTNDASSRTPATDIAADTERSRSGPRSGPLRISTTQRVRAIGPTWGMHRPPAAASATRTGSGASAVTAAT